MEAVMTKKSAVKTESRIRQRLLIAAVIAAVVTVTCWTFIRTGITGYGPDVYYHLNRIEGVKDALLAGHYPSAVDGHFFHGYGYASPAFYPDIFLIIPALLRIAGCSPQLSWKLFVLLLCVLACLTTYAAMHCVIRDWRFALCGMTLLVSSQFYLADLLNRGGLGSYTAYIFLPLVVAGTYDYLYADAQRVWWIGLGLTGMIFCHTIMAVIGVCVVVGMFLMSLLTPEGRRNIFEKRRFGRLLFSAVFCVLLCLWYLLPMLEQMRVQQLRYQTPWAWVSHYTEPFYVYFNLTGYFDTIAYVGIGMPILLLLLIRPIGGRPKNRWADIFFFGAGLLFLIMTRVFPWKLIEHTKLNSIQFTYRLYPYALCALVMGLMLMLEAYYADKKAKTMIVLILAGALIFGFWQNAANYSHIEMNNPAVEESDIEKHSSDVGMGEWLPTAAGDDAEVAAIIVVDQVRTASGALLPVRDSGWLTQETSVNGNEESVEFPRFFYKGYQAVFIDAEGKKTPLTVSASDRGLVQVRSIPHQSGRIELRYINTVLWTVSHWISLSAAVVLVLLSLFKKHFHKNDQKVSTDTY